MREEPVLYINGNPYVVREASKPFANLEITGEVWLPSYEDSDCPLTASLGLPAWP